MFLSHVLYFLLGLATTLSLINSKAWAQGNDEYQELTYDQIVSELHTKKKSAFKSNNSTDPYETLQIHFGLGYINSFTTVKAGAGQFQRYQNGMQLGIGMDLFDPEWYSELCFRNFGVTAHGTEEIMIKEFDLKIGHVTDLKYPWQYFFSTGVSNRFFHYSDTSVGMELNSTTPSWIGSFGLRAQVEKTLGFGLEVTGRTALIGGTADTSSMDFTFRIDTSM